MVQVIVILVVCAIVVYYMYGYGTSSLGRSFAEDKVKAKQVVQKASDKVKETILTASNQRKEGGMDQLKFETLIKEKGKQTILTASKRMREIARQKSEKLKSYAKQVKLNRNKSNQEESED